MSDYDIHMRSAKESLMRLIKFKFKSIATNKSRVWVKTPKLLNLSSVIVLSKKEEVCVHILQSLNKKYFLVGLNEHC